MPQTETLAVTPGSPLDRMLARLKRPERRLLLAAVTAAPGPRRARLERRVHARLQALGIEGPKVPARR